MLIYTKAISSVPNISPSSSTKPPSCVITSYSIHYTKLYEDIALVYINTQKADNYFGEPKVTATYDNVFFLDHEMGHFLADDETISQHISESISDAHASLRHVARFGNNTNYFENLINDVSLRPIFSSKFHS